MENLNQELDEISRQMAELRLKQKELEEKKKAMERQVEVHITKVSMTANRFHVKLSKYRSEIVDWLRYNTTERVYNEQVGNVVPLNYLEPFLNRLSQLEGVEIIWNSDALKAYEEWQKIPDLLVDVEKAYVTLQTGPKFQQSLWLESYISTFQREFGKGYRFAIAELYAFPEAIQHAYPNITPTYTDKAREILFEQVERRKQLAILANATDIDLPNPFKNGYDLKGHQRVAVKFSELCDNRAIIAYDMGTGKSAIAIAIAERHQNYKRILIICPAALKTNWKREIKKFTDEDAYMFSGIEPERIDMEAWINNNKRYFIINYDIIGRKNGKDDDAVMKWVEMFNLIPPDFVAIDEAHYIKNMDSNRSIGVRALKLSHVIPMSGTPLVNRPAELYPPLHVIAPDTFSSPTAFLYNFTNNDGTARNVKKLHEMMSTFMIRRTRKDVYGDKIHIERIPFSKELSPKARAIYTQILQGIYQSLRKPDYKRNVTSIFAELIRCKQTCSADNIEATAGLASDAYEETEKKVIIFSQFKESQSAIREYLGSSAKIINGDVRDEERYKIVDKFQEKNDEVKFIITNILEGLTLTEAHTVIFNDIWWTPKDHYQAEGRAFGRDNDPHGGNSYWLENENTIDQFLNALLMKKMAVFSEVIDGVRTSQEEQESVMSALMEHLKGSM